MLNTPPRKKQVAPVKYPGKMEVKDSVNRALCQLIRKLQQHDVKVPHKVQGGDNSKSVDEFFPHDLFDEDDLREHQCQRGENDIKRDQKPEPNRVECGAGDQSAGDFDRGRPVPESASG
jgi:hypothetical protein